MLNIYEFMMNQNYGALNKKRAKFVVVILLMNLPSTLTRYSFLYLSTVVNYSIKFYKNTNVIGVFSNIYYNLLLILSM